MPDQRSAGHQHFPGPKSRRCSSVATGPPTSDVRRSPPIAFTVDRRPRSLFRSGTTALGLTDSVHSPHGPEECACSAPGQVCFHAAEAGLATREAKGEGGVSTFGFHPTQRERERVQPPPRSGRSGPPSLRQQG